MLYVGSCQQGGMCGYLLLRVWSRGRDVLTIFLGNAELNYFMSDGYNVHVFIGDELKTDKIRILTITGTRESEVHESSRGRRWQEGGCLPWQYKPSLPFWKGVWQEDDYRWGAYPTTTGITDHGSDDNPEGQPATGAEKWGGTEKLLYVGGPKLSSQVLEGILHLYKYKGRSLFDLEQSDREGSPFLYDQTQEFSALRKRRGNVDCHRIS